jgi:hypothetical protein
MSASATAPRVLLQPPPAVRGVPALTVRVVASN